MLDFLNHLFPPPKFIDPPIVGLDVSDRSIKYVELSETASGRRLKRFGKKDLPPGIIVSGEIKKADEFSSLLASIFKPQKISRIFAAMPEERAYVSVIKLPEMEPSSMRDAIELELSRIIPLPAGEIIFDFELLPATIIAKDATITEDQPLHRDIMVYAFPRLVVQNYLDAYLNAGLLPEFFTMETVSLSRALIPADKSLLPVMIIDFGKTRTSFVIVAERLVRFSSTVNIAGAELDQAIAKSLKISLAEAEKIKKEKGLAKTAENQIVFDALLPAVSAIADEAERHVLFWNSHAEHVHKSSPEIAEIILTGGDANLIGLKDYLAHKLGLPVERGNPWINVASFEDYVPEIGFNEAFTFSAAIGLGLMALNAE
jgi:type IV pilus assembly protein PilM